MSVSAAMGKVLLLLGGAIAAVGAFVLIAGPRLERGGRLLPGDISWSRGDVSWHFPLGTCIAVSIVVSLFLTLALCIVGHWRQ
ncbi:MAG: DUF2905 domain-containing protein [Armatimonadota bacterium]|jgi:hypothetical protein